MSTGDSWVLNGCKRSHGLLTCKLLEAGVLLLFTVIFLASEQGLAQGRCSVGVC